MVYLITMLRVVLCVVGMHVWFDGPAPNVGREAHPHARPASLWRRTTVIPTRPRRARSRARGAPIRFAAARLTTK